MNGKAKMIILLILLTSPSAYAEALGTITVGPRREVAKAEIIAFLSPDSSFSELRNFLSGYDTLFISTYTFSNPYIMDQLIKLTRERNAEITIMVEKSPIGGLSPESKAILCKLQKNNISVFLYDGPLRFMHAKYIIKQTDGHGSVLISTENFGNNGFPFYNSYGNRGWNVIVENDKIANELLSIFTEDLKTSKRFNCDLDEYQIDYPKITGNYKPVFKVSKYKNQSARLIIAPDAVQPVLDLINEAEQSIFIEQFYVYPYWGMKNNKTENKFLEAVINKARHGVDVKVLMDSYWYNIQESNERSNIHTLRYINKIAKDKNISIKARLIDLKKLGLEKMHAKGIVIDNKTVLISTINWNENSPRNNREIGIVINGDAALYFSNAFMHDWDGVRGATGFVVAHKSSWIFGTMIIVIVILFFIKIRKKFL